MGLHPFRAAARAGGTLTAAIAAIVVAAGTVAGPAPAAEAMTSVRSGVFEGGAAAPQVQEFEKWRGRDVGIVSAFVPNATWSDVQVPDWFTRHWGGSEFRDRMLVTLAMLPTQDTSATLATGATGAYDHHFVTAARNLVAGGMGSATIRVGHELNGTWYRWSAKNDPAAYAAYFRRIVTAMRSVPGQSFRFEWNVSVGVTSWDATRAYPGDAWVDYIGQDVYDLKWGDSTATPEARWAHRVTPTTGTYRHGLQFWADFAAARSKKLAFSEWGLVDKYAKMANGGGGGDNPYFIQSMRDWMSTHPTAFDVYFNVDKADGKHRLGNPEFPRAAAQYKAVFGAPPRAQFPLLVSSSSDRSAATPVAGTTLTGRVYVFATPSSEPRKVRFYLDDPQMTAAPRRTDWRTAWDFAGTTAVGTAMPFDVSTLTAGTHTITAVADYPDGSTRTASATFLVR